MDKTANEVGVREYAKRRGVDQKSVTQAIKAGRIPARKVGRNYQIPVEEADAAWEENTKMKADNICDGDSDGKITYASERAKRERYNAELARMQVEERQGLLLPVAIIKEQAITTARAVRNALLDMPTRISVDLAAETDPLKVENMLTAEIRTVLEELSNYESRYS